MAIDVGRIPAFDKQPKVVGLGLALPFGNGAVSGSDGVFTVTYTTADQIRTNMINYLLHSKGERPLNPDFGARMADFLFEQADADLTSTISSYISDEIEVVFPQVKLKGVTTTLQEDINAANIVIQYDVFNSIDEFLELNIPL